MFIAPTIDNHAEDHDPDDVNEVPVVRDGLERNLPLITYLAGNDQTQQCNKHQQPERHVDRVKACEREVGAPEKIAADRDGFLEQARILTHLAEKKHGAEQDGRYIQSANRFLFFPSDRSAI